MTSEVFFDALHQIVDGKATCYDAPILQQQVVGKRIESQFFHDVAFKHLSVADDGPRNGVVSQ